MNIQKYIANLCQNTSSSSDRDVINSVRNNLSELGIRCNYDPPESKDNRMLIYTKYISRLNQHIAKDCNGVIFDYQTWEPICVPPMAVKPNYNPNNVNRNFDKYKIYKAEDGTVVSLYYYNSQWCISTVRGIQMNDVIWQGISYMDALVSVLGEYKEFDWEQLDKSVTYTLGFTYPGMHASARKKAWFICGTESKTFVQDWKMNIGLPGQTEYKAESLDELLRKCEDEKNTDVGYILRAPISMPDSSVFLETVKMRRIRKLVYDRRLYSELDKFKLDKTKYLLTLAFADETRRKPWLEIFPHDAPIIQKMDELSKDVILKVSNMTAETAKSGTRDTATCIFNQLAIHRDPTKMSRVEVSNTAINKNFVILWYRLFWEFKATAFDELDDLASLLEKAVICE